MHHDTLEKRKENFLRKAEEKYGDQYSYGKVDYINSRTKIIITCKDHGDFERKPNEFLSGRICKYCNAINAVNKIHIKKDITEEEFSEMVKEVSDSKYSVVVGSFSGISKECLFYCKDHGEFKRIARTMGDGGHCPSCHNETQRERGLIAVEEVITRIQHKYPDLFEYDRIGYVDCQNEITLKCKKHNTYFTGIPKLILKWKNKCPCPICEEERNKERKVVNHEEDKQKERKREIRIINRQIKRAHKRIEEAEKKLKKEEREEELRNILESGERECHACGKTKKLEEFTLDRNDPCGYNAKCKECEKEYRSRPEVKARKYEIHRDRLENDPIYKISRNIRKRIHSVMRTEYSQNTLGKGIDLFGCSGVELQAHIESLFTEGMTWDNYGPYGWHVDHIIQVRYFDLSDDEQVKQCNHYTNLQPLWWQDNLSKG